MREAEKGEQGPPLILHISAVEKYSMIAFFLLFSFAFFFFAEPQKPSKMNGNKLKGECVYVCVCA